MAPQLTAQGCQHDVATMDAIVVQDLNCPVLPARECGSAATPPRRLPSSARSRAPWCGCRCARQISAPRAFGPVADGIVDSGLAQRVGADAALPNRLGSMPAAWQCFFASHRETEQICQGSTLCDPSSLLTLRPLFVNIPPPGDRPWQSRPASGPWPGSPGSVPLGSDATAPLRSTSLAAAPRPRVGCRKGREHIGLEESGGEERRDQVEHPLAQRA
jgi:hypothetical protein